MENKDIIEVEKEEEQGSTLAKGNYIVEVKSKNNVIKKIVVANAEINISKLADDGFTVDLK